MPKHLWGNLCYQKGRSVLPNPLVIKITRFDRPVNHRSALFGEALNLHEMAEYITNMAVRVRFEQDNQAAITKQLENKNFNLEHCETFTKIISNGVEWHRFAALMRSASLLDLHP